MRPSGLLERGSWYMGVINIEAATRTLPQRAQKGGSSMGNRRETIRGADAVCMAQNALELVLNSADMSTLR